MPGDLEAQALLEGDAEEKRRSRTLRVQLDNALKRESELRRTLDLIGQLEAARLAPPKWLAPGPSGKKRHSTVCLLVTDTHFDEIVRPSEVDHLNKYDRQIAEMRLRRVFEKTVHLTREYLSGVSYDGCVLFLGGDLFSGNIHDELKETNTSTLFDAVVHWIEHMEAGIRMLADEFKHVRVVAVVGNHGRMTRKPRAKLRAQDNVDWLLYKFLARDFAKDDRVSFNIPEGADAFETIHRTRFLLTHGDQFRGGSGISGAMAPLLLGTHRKTRRQSVAGNPYDIMVMGHFHQTLMLPSKGLMVGGSLKGMDEYAYVSNFEPEPASQLMWLVTPEYGVGFSLPIVVQDRKAERW